MGGDPGSLIISFADLAPKTRSDFSLLAANLAVLALSLYGGWGVNHLLWLYSGETLVIALINIPKIFFAAKPAIPGYGEKPKGPASKFILSLFIAAFFCFHFGVFYFTQSVLLYACTFGKLGYSLPEPAKLLLADIKLPILLLAASHVVSFFTNYLPKERFNVYAYDCMTRPYGRLLLTYPAMGIGALAAKLLGGGAAAVVIFVLLKVTLDLRSHKLEREKLGNP